MTKETLLKSIKASCPILVTRKKAQELTCGLIKAKTLANKDSLGLGPSVKASLGKTVAYPRDVFIDWLADNLVVEHEC